MLEKTKAEVARSEDEIAETVRNLFEPSWIRSSPSLWPGIRKAIAASAPEPTAGPENELVPFGPAFPGWKWAVPASIAVVASVGLALIGFRSSRETPVVMTPPAMMAIGPGPRVEVLSTALAGSPAKAFLFQTKDASYVWLVSEKSPGRMK
jgi:hypothetical protein